MDQVKRCSMCHVPLQFSRMNVWNADGTITQARNPGHRLFFYDASGFDRLFDNVSEIIGAPIGHIVMESRRRATLDYIETLLSGPLGLALRTFQRRKAYAQIATMASLLGYGHFEVKAFRRGELVSISGENTYCENMAAADLVAIFNYLEGLPADIHIENFGEGRLFTMSEGAMFGGEPASRLEYRKIRRKPGSLIMERCPECEAPIDFKKFSWHMDRGVITDRDSGRDMVLVGPSEIDAIFGELEAELGPEINRAIVEGQSRYVRDELQHREKARGSGYLALQLALRGMGNLVRFEMGRDRLRAEVENASPYLMVTGLIKGVFESLTGRRSWCDYRLNDHGTLFIEAGKSPTSVMEVPAGLEA